MKTETEILNRKGARKVADIPQEVLALLNKGEIESANLTEWLAISHLALIQNNFIDLGISQKIIDSISQEVKKQKKPTTMNAVKLVGSLLYENYLNGKDYHSIFNNLRTHKSDSIRCYAPYLITLNKNLKVGEKLQQLKKIVKDKHFGVREIVWMSVRPEIELNLHEAIVILTDWADDEDENIRRFTTEAIRPRGVWCKHLEALKEEPELALSILEKLKSDKSKYVQDSLGNWLNDSSKTKPIFVMELCDRWNKESPTTETKKIIKRARRTLDKK